MKFYKLSSIVLSLIVMTLAAPTTFAADFPSKIHRLYNNGVCGDMPDGSVGCLDSYLDKTHTFETITTITDASDAYANSNGICVKDTEGIRCAVEQEGFPLRDLIASAEAGSIKMETYNACGIEPGGNLFCLVPDWYQQPDKTFRHKLPAATRTIGLGYDRVCWADDEKIECRESSSKNLRAFTFKAADEITIAGSLVCARNSSEAKCFSTDGREIVLSQDFLTANKWLGDYSYFCAITSDERFVCADWTTGAPDLLNNAKVPPEFQLAGSGATYASILESYQMCVARRGSNTANCWYTYGGPGFNINFDSEIVSLQYGVDNTVCAYLKSGEYECRNSQTRVHRMLKKSGPLRAAKGFQWNQSGVTGRDASALQTIADVRSVDGDSDGRNICAIGTLNGREGAYCTQYGSVASTPPYDLRSATSISVGSDKACAIQGGDALCWGADYSGEARPSSFWNVSRLVLGLSHACAIDDFGLICWGDLSAGRQVPSALTAPGEVLDVALGYNRTCALLKNQTVQCWGNKSRYDAEAPALTGVTELVGSRQYAFCAKNASGYHCWSGPSQFPK